MLRWVILLCLFSSAVYAQVLSTTAKSYDVSVSPSVNAAALYLDTNDNHLVLSGIAEVHHSTTIQHSCGSPVVVYVCRFADGDSIVSAQLNMLSPVRFVIVLKGRFAKYCRKDKRDNLWHANEKLLKKIQATPLVSVSISTVSYWIIDGHRVGNPHYNPMYTFLLSEATATALQSDMRAALH